MNPEDPLSHLIAAIVSLAAALDSLHRRDGDARADSHVRQDAHEHLDELEVLLRLIAKLL